MLPRIELLLAFVAGLYLACLGYGHRLGPRSLAGRKWIGWMGIVLTLLTIETGIAWIFVEKTETPVEALQAAGHDILAKALAETLRGKTTLPAPIDEMTTLSNIETNHGQVVYDITINTNNAQTFDKIVTDTTGHLLDTACQRDDYRQLFRWGVGIEIRLSMADGTAATPLVFTSKTCGD